MKIKDILNKKDIEKEEKLLVLSDILNESIPSIKLDKNKELSFKNYLKYRYIATKIKKGLPVQYALKKAYFYDDVFYIKKGVLIPRPETEYLVQKTNDLINNKFNKNIDILDIGTGSGVIAISLKKLDGKRNATGSDISKKALKIAKLNSKRLNKSVKFVRTNILDNLEEKYDVIISNPPYIDFNSKNVEEKVKKNEPYIALFAKNEGLYFYEEILKNSGKVLKKDHIIAFEIGDNQGQKIKKIAKKYFPNDEILLEKDYNGFDRYIFVISK